MTLPTNAELVCAILLHATAMANSLNRESAIRAAELALVSLKAGKADLSVVGQLEYPQPDLTQGAS